LAGILIVRFSDSFADLWHQLASGLQTDVQVVSPADVSTPPPTTLAMVVAAGGVERDTADWLESHANGSDLPIYVVGADTDRRTTSLLMSHGATDYFAVPDDLEILRNALESALTRRREHSEMHVDGNGAATFGSIVGQSPAIKAVLARAERMLRHPHGTALILGETGTGKELLARAIHEGGPRRGAPFVPVNCSALPPTLIESELFGHEKGAFTDAHAAKPGLFEVAHGGTILLDEIDTFPIDLQAKLLRVLEDQEVRRVGGTKTRRVDVRVIASTNSDLESVVARGAFRQDLYFRLGVITLVIPPLRARGNDVLLVAERLISTLAQRHRIRPPVLSAEAQRALLGYSWPGNIRELKNALERALLLSHDGELSLTELIPVSAMTAPNQALPFPADLEAIMAAAGRAMLESCAGNVSEAARRLNVSRRRLRRLVDAERNVRVE
jgi:DNA-binding NtrC family response regulator